MRLTDLDAVDQAEVLAERRANRRLLAAAIAVVALWLTGQALAGETALEPHPTHLNTNP